MIYVEENFIPVGGESPIGVGNGEVRIRGGGEDGIAVASGKNFITQVMRKTASGEKSAKQLMGSIVSQVVGRTASQLTSDEKEHIVVN